MEATQKALFRLERWSEYWCLLLNPSKYEASFFSVDPRQSNLQTNLLLLGSRLRFNPTPTFLGVTFDRTLSFTKHVSLLKAKFFPRLKALRCISASSWGHSKESLSLLYKSFLRSLLTYASPGWFPFLSATNFIKLERLHRAASRAITGCLSSCPIPLLSEAFLPPSTSHPDSFHSFILLGSSSPNLLSHFRIGQTWSETKTLQIVLESFCVHSPAMLPSTCSRKAFLLSLPVLLGICLPPRWSPPFPLHALALIPLSHAKVRLSPTLTLPLMIWCFGLTALFLFL